MCGSVSAIGLEQRERELWPSLRERLRKPGHLMALMRGVLGDTEVAAIVAVTPQGVVELRAILAISETRAAEIQLLPLSGGRSEDADVRPAKVGDYDVEVMVDRGPDGQPRPLAILTSPWIEQHLLLYARNLWHRRQPATGQS
jgi:hypothetical protein